MGGGAAHLIRSPISAMACATASLNANSSPLSSFLPRCTPHPQQGTVGLVHTSCIIGMSRMAEYTHCSSEAFKRRPNEKHMYTTPQQPLGGEQGAAGHPRKVTPGQVPTFFSPSALARFLPLPWGAAMPLSAR